MHTKPLTPLKRIRKQQGLTLRVVATAVGMDTSTLCDIENGKPTSARMAEKLARYFGRQVTEMEILYPERYTLM